MKLFLTVRRSFLEITGMKIVMLGQKHTFSREGGVEVVVKELATRMVSMGHKVVCFDRKTKPVSGATWDTQIDTKGVKVVPVWSIDRKGLAALTSSISAAWKASRSKADVVHIHAEGPAAMAWLPKLFHKKVVVTVHGKFGIIEPTKEKPVKSRFYDISVAHHNSNDIRDTVTLVINRNSLCANRKYLLDLIN